MTVKIFAFTIKFIIFNKSLKSVSIGITNTTFAISFIGHKVSFIIRTTICDLLTFTIQYQIVFIAKLYLPCVACSRSVFYACDSSYLIIIPLTCNFCSVVFCCHSTSTLKTLWKSTLEFISIFPNINTRTLFYSI